MADLLLIVRLAGKRIAVPAANVEGVVELEGIEPVPGASAHIAGLSALRSRVLTVIDCRVTLGLGAVEPGQRLDAIVVPSGGHTYALLVDEVEDVVDAGSALAPLQAPIGDGWDAVGLGMITAEGDLLLLVDPHALIAGPLAQAA